MQKPLGIPEQLEHAISLTNTRIAHILAKAAPAIERSSVNSGFRRVIVNVTNAAEQLIIIKNRHALKSILEEWTLSACLRIEIHGIRRRNRMHAITQMSMLIVKQKMNMVIHKAPRDDINFELLVFRSNQPNQIESIILILKYQLTTTPLLNDMVKAIFRDFSRSPSHTHSLLYR